MSAALKYEDYYTTTDYKGWEGEWELIQGMPYAMAPFALPRHQRVNGKIFRQLDEKLEECKKCTAFIEVEVEFSYDTVVRPDTLVYCHEYLDTLNKTPSIIFEVVSVGSIKRDEVLKKELYEKEGVKYYVLVYPDRKSAKIYELINARFIKVKDIEQENYVFDIECEIEFDFSKIWE
jgi:Uma2 family endonuclease